MAGFALAKYRFRGRGLVFGTLLAGVLVPQIAYAVPQYLLLAELDLAGGYWSVLLPGVISPFGIYLCSDLCRRPRSLTTKSPRIEKLATTLRRSCARAGHAAASSARQISES